MLLSYFPLSRSTPTAYAKPSSSPPETEPSSHPALHLRSLFCRFLHHCHSSPFPSPTSRFSSAIAYVPFVDTKIDWDAYMSNVRLILAI
ncbi:hypothetical protein L1987_02316 [Smallanthus sonchifolius]|uniref:Uncharacterized protein n=1 Tax=Smallanthus sonchifolius TaxID=185202 RepID=A0ACB9K7J5_9ASTR|nr:hypothetical protein L1987_02316 [Smallanthus sonchifolius]